MANGIPSVVQQQADEARRKAEQAAAGETPEPESPEEPAPSNNEPASSEATEEGQPETAAKQPEQMNRDELQSELDKPLPPSAEEGTQDAYWEHRFKVVKGLLDKEKAQFNREREQFNQRIRELEDQLRQQPQQPAQQDADLSQLREEYGSEDPMVQSLEAEREHRRRLEQQIQSLQGNQQESAEERFWSDLNGQVPDWETINARQDFLEWLNLPDPVSGEIRDTLLQRHQANSDGQRAAAIFDAFLNDNPQARQELRGKPEPQQPDPRLQEQVEPTRTKTEPESEQAPVYPLSEYKQFMTDITKGKYSGDKAEYWQNEYSRAIAEGRVDHSR